jgi:hypothetical protein
MAMGPNQTKFYEHVNKLLETTSKATTDYWLSYSNFSTWRFWVLLALFILPLICLFIFIDRKKALLIGFYGLNIHIWFHYADTYGVMIRLWNYPYKVIPFMPMNLTLDASLVPVTFMLFYQWILKHNKNYYVYAIGLSAFLSFLLKPALTEFQFFRLTNGIHYFYLFIIYIAVACLAKWITNIFIYAEKDPEEHPSLPNESRFFLRKLLFRMKEKAR